jgi:hypothetical protein
MPDELNPEGVKQPIVIEPEPRIARLRRWLKTPAELRTWADLRGWLMTTLAPPSTYGGRLAVAVIVVLLLVPLWLWYASGQKDDKNAVTYPHASLLNPILGGLGALLLIYAAIRQARTASEQAETARKQAQIAADRHAAQTNADLQRRTTETFSKAISQLASDKLEERLGGIYTLENISKESADDYWTVMENLTAFVREHTRRTERHIEVCAYLLWEKAGRPDGCDKEFWERAVAQETGGRQGVGSRVAADITAVLEVIKRRSADRRALEAKDERRLDLRGAILRDAMLHGAHLERANLNYAHLEDAILFQAHLEGAWLWGAHLERANLAEAHLNNALLNQAHLERTILGGAHLKGANLDGAHLKRVYLDGVHLEGTDLRTAYLDDVGLLEKAHGDARTWLPWTVERPKHWPPYEEPPRGAFPTIW